MAFSTQFLDELRARIAIADVVGRRVQLRRKGRELWGLCPFHKEKTPSFKVDPGRGNYHCFGCGEHGSAIDFVMASEGLNFPEAVEQLANQIGLPIPLDTPEERQRAETARTLHQVVEQAHGFFQKMLRLPEGQAGLDYLRRRGLDDAIIERFGLGWAPDRRGALKSALVREGVPEPLLVAAGLVIKPDDETRPSYDRFRGRVMFPITDRQGRIIAFGGRLIGEGEPKYLNSPETPLFHKGRVLYGLAQARKAARRSKTLLVTEGYMDVIALARAGFDNAVAPLGTALTEEQIQELWKLAPEPVLCFDGDAAGRRAAERAAERALPLITPEVSLYFALLPPGDDPDSLIATKGAPAFKAVLDAAVPLSEVIWRSGVGNGDRGTPEVRASVWQRLRDRLATITNPIVRRSFEVSFRERFWHNPNATTRGGAGRWDNKPRRASYQSAEKAGQVVKVERQRLHEEILLLTLINHPQLMDVVGERFGSLAFTFSDLDKLRQEVLNTLSDTPGIDRAALADYLSSTEHADIVDQLSSGDAVGHAFFARPDAEAATALQGWEEIYRYYGRRTLEAEIQEAQRQLAETMTEEALARLRALQDMEQQLVNDGGDSVSRGFPLGARIGDG